MGDSGQPGARLRARGARARGELDDAPGRPSRRCCCRCSCSRSRSSTRRSSRSCALLERRPVTPGRPRPQLAPARLLRPLRSAGGRAAARSSRRARRDGLAYNVLDEPRMTAIGVARSRFVAARPVRRASSTDLEERARRGRAGRRLAAPRARLQPRRLVEVLVDFVLISGSFLAAYLLRRRRHGHRARSAASSSPRCRSCSGCATSLFVPLPASTAASGATRRRATRSRSRAACVVSDPPPSRSIAATRRSATSRTRSSSSTRSSAPPLVGALAAARCGSLPRPARAHGRGDQRRVLVVGAGRAGRSLARELRETPERAGRRLPRRQPARCAAAGSRASRCSARLDEIAPALIAPHAPDDVLVTIPNAPGERLDSVVAACARGRGRRAASCAAHRDASRRSLEVAAE